MAGGNPRLHHPNRESELEVDPGEGEERQSMEDLVPDGMNDESNIEDPADSTDVEGGLQDIENLAEDDETLIG